MGILQVATTLLALGGAGLGSPVLQGRAAKYVDASTGVAYVQYQSPENIAIRVAIPDTATVGNFDALLQIDAPKTVGWAGVAWGGIMVNNPLTVGWANGNTTVVSSRSAASRTYPTPYAGATYTVLSGSTANSTHWTLKVLAKGVSSWGSTKLDPSGNVTLAYAQSSTPPTEPASNTSRFSIHNSHQKFSIDLKSAQIANFTELVAQASA